ncbi:MAG: S41 family peptidase [Bacteroidales bacterium]
MRGIKLLFFLSFIWWGCTEEWLQEPYSNSPTGVFDAVWEEYDQTYGAFEAKGINWDSCRRVFRARLTPEANSDTLYNVLCGLLRQLNDGHVQLIANGYKRFYSVPIPTIFPDSKYYENASEISMLFDVIKSRYLSSYVDSGNCFYGIINLKTVPKYIGYLYISGFDRESFSTDFIDRANMAFAHCAGLIIDLRFNGGGSSEVLTAVANRYADQKRIFILSKIRNGRSHNDFTSFISHIIRPEGVNLGQKPLVVLVNRHTASSAEHFVLAMRARPHTLIVGDTTAGALSTVVQRIAPNGWEFRTCPQVLYDTTGQLLRNADGRYPDGIGLPPDLYVRNMLKEIYRGYDRVMATTLNYFEDYFNEIGRNHPTYSLKH